ncbi:DUF4381 domain-containing protein [Thiofilum flexile]|uniref:DUF4381 domain-containing protein n=1 Tax=Thiofilum flexile TaxID=125627 RepID=UPI00037D5115|nr:DUF4381 domain-containing protein [Thiofilum flexile]
MTPSTTELPLRPIHFPDPIGWWPPAIGWWLLLILGAIALGMLLVEYHKYRTNRRRLAIQQALKELKLIEQHYHNDKRQLVQAVSSLLRRVAMQQYGRSQTAGLTGAAWAEFLQQAGNPVMSADLAHALSEMPYRPIEDVNSTQLIQQVRTWINAQLKPQLIGS